jgi:hypothetical protein
MAELDDATTGSTGITRATITGPDRGVELQRMLAPEASSFLFTWESELFNEMGKFSRGAARNSTVPPPSPQTRTSLGSRRLSRQPLWFAVSELDQARVMILRPPSNIASCFSVRGGRTKLRLQREFS